jgi:hypothetical protein
MKSKIGQFAVIYSKINWDQYCREMVSQLTGGKQGLTHAGAVSFPDEPTSFPCLVASMLTPDDPTKANKFCHYRINCCYVYPQDAQRLIDAQAQLDHSIVVTEPANYETVGSLDPVPKPTADLNECDYAPTQTGVLLLALVNELEAVGALKRDKLLAELKRVEQWLIDNQADNLENASLAAVLQRMWRDKDAC